MPNDRDYRPMTMRELFALPVGGKFVVYWAKDDDEQYVRFDFEERTVVTNDGKEIADDDGEDWSYNEHTVPTDHENLYDTSRGYAYFYYPKPST